MSDTDATLRNLIREYRPSMDRDVVHSWAADAVKALATAEREGVRMATVLAELLSASSAARTAEATSCGDEIYAAQETASGNVEAPISVNDGLIIELAAWNRCGPSKPIEQHGLDLMRRVAAALRPTPTNSATREEIAETVVVYHDVKGRVWVLAESPAREGGA